MKLSNLYPNTVSQMGTDITKQLEDIITYYSKNKQDYTVDTRLSALSLLEDLSEIKTYFLDYGNMFDIALELEEIEKRTNVFLSKMLER